jgi:rhodanese-related sulfurtransferase
VFGTPAQIRELAAAGRLIDVRTPAEFDAVRIPGAINIPLDAFNLHVARLAALDGMVGLTCHSGKRAEQARALLAACQKVDVAMVEGGTAGWEARGGTVIRGTPVMSLERQVRIAAGALVALGAILALTVHPYFAALPLAVGSGLVFAGVTDTCMLGMLLARMPWNTRRGPDAEFTVGLLEATCSRSA